MSSLNICTGKRWIIFIVSPEKVERKWSYTSREVLLLCDNKNHCYSRGKPFTSMYILTKPFHKKNTIHLAFWSKNIAVLYFPFSQICIEGDSIEVNHPYGSLSTFFLANVEGKMGMILQSHWLFIKQKRQLKCTLEIWHRAFSIYGEKPQAPFQQFST